MPFTKLSQIIRKVVDYLLSPPNVVDLPIKNELLYTLGGHVTMIMFGGICVAGLNTIYAFLSSGIAGSGLLCLIIFGICYRISVTRHLKEDLQNRPESTAYRFVASGLLWGCIVGLTGAVCAFSRQPSLVITTACTISALAFGTVSMNAAAPRFAKLQNLAIVVPFLFALYFTGLPHIWILAIQGPIWIVGTFTVIDRLYRNAAKLIHSHQENVFLASHDFLTGLYNRSYVFQKIENLRKERIPDSKSSLNYILYLDLDGFKSVNDRYGHEKGDDLLKSVSKRLSSLIRKEDCLARLGGDEFIAVIVNMNCDDTYAVAKRMVEHLGEPFHLDGSVTVTIGVSIGGARLEDKSYDAPLARADKLLYAAKHAGKGTVKLDCGLGA